MWVAIRPALFSRQLVLVRTASTAIPNLTTLIRDLRVKTNAGLADCKKALEATNGDMNEAVEWLRKKGVQSASKLSSRVSREGLIAVALGAKDAVMLEVNSETDFVARNDKFQNFARQLAQLASQVPAEGTACATTLSQPISLAALGGLKIADPVAPTSPPVTVSEGLLSLSSNVGENLRISRGARVESNQGIVGAYVHNQVAENMGTIGAIVALQAAGSDLTEDQLASLRKHASSLAMHIVGSNSRYLSVDACSGPEVDSERAISREVASQTGKPADVVEKMVEGRMRKFYEEAVLLEQKCVFAENAKVQDWLKQIAKHEGVKTLSISAFARLKLGD